jgi:hypothetical protein
VGRLPEFERSTLSQESRLDMCNVLIAASSALTYIPVREPQSNIAGLHARADVQQLKEMPAAVDADTFTGDEIAVD